MKKFAFIIIFINFMFALTGYEIAESMDQRNTPIDSKVDLQMTLTNKKGKTRIYSMRSIIKNDGEKQIVWFISPPDDKGISFLKIEHDDKDDEMRMWLPAFKKVRRISSKKKGDAFMGSDLSYEDLSSRELNENDYNRMEDDPVNGIDCYVLEIIPKKEAKSSYIKHVSLSLIHI